MIINSYRYIIPATGNMLANGTFDGTTYWSFGDSWTNPDSNRAYFDDIEYTSAGLILGQAQGDMLTGIQSNTSYTLVFPVSIASGNALIEISNLNRSIAYVTTAAYNNDTHTVQFTTPADVGIGGFAFRASTSGDGPFSIAYATLTVD